MNLWNPFNETFKKNPYPTYEAIRAYGPLYKTQTGEFIITDYQYVNQILKDKENISVGNGKLWLERGINYFKTKNKDFEVIIQAIDSFLLFIDPPRHLTLRRFITDIWNDKEVESIIERNCITLIQNINQSTFDLVKTFTSPLPAITICDILGLDYQQYKHLSLYAGKMMKAQDFYLRLEDLVKIDDSSKVFVQTFKTIIQNPPKKGVLKNLVNANKLREEPLTENELISIAIFLFITASETTVSFITTAVYHLLDKNRWNDMHKHPIDRIINELLRYDCPVHLIGRIAKNEITIGSELIPKNSNLILALAAANRDPKAFERPEEINYSREGKHLAFGNGQHYCLGDWLAKKQASIALKCLFIAFPKLQLTERSITWCDFHALRRIKHLYLKH